MKTSHHQSIIHFRGYYGPKLHHYIQQPGTSPLSTTFNFSLIYVVNLYCNEKQTEDRVISKYYNRHLIHGMNDGNKTCIECLEKM